MPSPRVLILRAPGTNCDHETEFAFELAGGKPQRYHINRLLENPAAAAQFQVLCLPGGFSYGDDIAAGRILATQIQHHIQDVLAEFQAAGKLILGICNGFQVLLKAGLLLPTEGTEPVATLTWNERPQFLDCWVNLRRDGDRCVFLDGADSLYLPIAHAEGKFVTRDAATLERLQQAGQLVLKYAPSQPNAPSPGNPNGSMGDVAGVCDRTGRVFGLMPHPERHIDPTQHPQWTRLPENRCPDGLAIFENAVRYFT